MGERAEKGATSNPAGDLSPPNTLAWGGPVPRGRVTPPLLRWAELRPSPSRWGVRGEPTPHIPHRAPFGGPPHQARGLGPRALLLPLLFVLHPPPPGRRRRLHAGPPDGAGWGGDGAGRRRRRGARGGGARGLGCGRGEGAGARGLDGARPGARAVMGEGWRRLHAPALRQSPTAAAAAAAAPRSLRNAAAPHNHGVRGHGSGLLFPALPRGQDRTGAGAGRREAAFLSALGCVNVCCGCV